MRRSCSPIRYGGRDVLITDCRVTPSKYPHRWTLTEHEKRCGAGPDAVGGRRSTGCLYQTYTGDTPIAGFRPGNIVLRNITAECCDRLVVSLSGIPGAIWQNGVGIPDVTLFGKNVTVIDEGTELENVNGPFFAERDVTYEDIPEFPSWQVESAETRRLWGLPPVEAKPR